MTENQRQERAGLRTVNRAVPKKDSMQLLLGKPVYTDDVAPKDALVVKILRSPHANAIVEEIDTAAALKIPGVAAVYTWRDVPQTRFTIAGQTYPEPSPYDRLILDRHVRFSGDAVAIIAAETEKAALQAMKVIKVKYQVLEAVLDMHTAKDNPILVHPEEDWYPPCAVGGDNRRNLVASDTSGDGDVEAVLADCDIVLDRTYHTKAFNQAMMETFRTYTELDRYGRLHVISSTQIVFHVRRILSRALGIPKSRIRVEKPRIGGGFGAKQTAVCEVYPAFVTLQTGRPAKLIYTREEAQIAGSPRHEMEHPGHRPVHPVQHRRLQRARPHHGGPVGPQGHPPLHRQSGSLPLRLRRGLHQPPGRRRLPRLRRDPGHLRLGDHRQRAG